VRIGVEEAVLEDHLDDDADRDLRDLGPLVAVLADGLVDLVPSKNSSVSTCFVDASL
jgi:hypothetical protein